MILNWLSSIISAAGPFYLQLSEKSRQSASRTALTSRQSAGQFL